VQIAWGYLYVLVARRRKERMCPGPKHHPSSSPKAGKAKDPMLQKSDKAVEGVDEFYWSYTDEPHKSR
jgi:hypothetical protein